MFNWSWYDMALDAISLAISPYIARANKAVEFYTTNYNLTSDTGLMMAIAEGPILEGTIHSGWSVDSTGSEVVPLPSLNTYDLDNIIGFKRVSTINFVIPDNNGNLSVGGVTWSKINSDSLDELTRLAYVKKSRWIYVDAELTTSEFANRTYRQVGLYSNLKVDTTVVSDPGSKTIFLPSEIKKVEKTVSLYDNRVYDGILEVYQNKSTTTRSSEYKEMFAWVLEF